MLMVESSQYISAQSQQTLSIPLFLDNVILKTGKNMEEFRAELQEREERQTRKAAEESLLRNRTNGVEGSASPSPDYEMNDSTLTKLASSLAPQWKKLAEAMETDDKKMHELQGHTVNNFLRYYTQRIKQSSQLLISPILECATYFFSTRCCGGRLNACLEDMALLLAD
ncbi:unnamed protein product [Heligmosomoides polygyrus]|uniref:Uncharacterized protein n=1 Tax=Heligmosomoides polygyrus TaxID=6339 RepID=A0A3P7THZ1_HELPZ|nr:unnamed protein product [Heligmosomoides polygyrus]